jgi:tripartite-type tricarboxylate transporter receptor subunit TctC
VYGKILACLALAFGLIAAPLHAAEAPDFKGKTVRIIVGTSPGGGFDAYARIIAIYLPKHIPGNPRVIVQNMAGAGSLTAANYIANAAPKDGTVIGAVNPTIVTDSLFYPERFKFDARKVKWLGSALRETHVAIAWRTSKINRFDDVFHSELVVAGSGGTSSTYPALLNGVLGTHFRIVAGYPGTAEGNLAMERGEVEGNGGITWASLKATEARALADRNLKLLVQFGLTRHPELTNVPWIFDYAKSDADRAALNLVLTTQEFGRPYFVAEGVPDATVAMLRAAFDATMKDMGFRADAHKRGLDLEPVAGADIQGMVAAIYATRPDVVARVRTILDAVRR